MSYGGDHQRGHGYGNRQVRSFQSSRSKRAKTMDSMKRAPIAKTEAQWLKDPSHFDLKGVDTPKSVKKAPQSEAQKVIAKIIKLQLKKDELSKKSSMIQSTAAFGQLPPVFFETTNKEARISQEQAELWNEIRGYETKNGDTLWQLAEAKNFQVKKWGNETGLYMSVEDLQLLQNSLPD